MKAFPISVAPAIASVPRPEWDALEGGRNLYASHAWLGWAEAGTESCARYVLARDADGRLVGALPVYLVSGVETSWSTWYDPLTVFAGADPGAAERRPGWRPMLALGSLSGYSGDLLVDGSLAVQDQAEVTRAVFSRCAELASELGAQSLAMMYVPAATASTAADWLPGSTRPLLTSATATISARWTSLDAYLESFPRRRRANLQREIAVFASSGSPVERRRLSECLDEVGPLLGNVHRKHGADDSDADTTAYLASQAAHLDDLSCVFVERVDGRPVGFSLCYAWHRTLYVRVVGFDYARSARFAYFNLAYYLPLAWAIERGLDRIDVGPGTYEAKTHRGARLEPTWSVVRPPDGASRSWFERVGQVGEDAREAAPWL